MEKQHWDVQFSSFTSLLQERLFTMEKQFFERQNPWKRDENGIMHPVKVPRAKQAKNASIQTENADYFPGSFSQP